MHARASPIEGVTTLWHKLQHGLHGNYNTRIQPLIHGAYTAIRRVSLTCTDPVVYKVLPLQILFEFSIVTSSTWASNNHPLLNSIAWMNGDSIRVIIKQENIIRMEVKGFQLITHTSNDWIIVSSATWHDAKTLYDHTSAPWLGPVPCPYGTGHKAVSRVRATGHIPAVRVTCHIPVVRAEVRVMCHIPVVTSYVSYTRSTNLGTIIVRVTGHIPVVRILAWSLYELRVTYP
jgi:hypothetical protein